MEFENLFEMAADSKPAMDEEAMEDEIINPMLRSLEGRYWHTETLEDHDGNLNYELISTDGPKIIVKLIARDEDAE